MRIAWYVHPLRLGGLEKFLIRLARQLDTEQVRVVAFFLSHGKVSEAFIEQGVESHVLESPTFRTAYESLSEAYARHHIDAVQTNMFTPLAAIAAGQKRIPHIWRVGGHPDVALRRMNPSARREQLEIMALQSAAVICNSDFVAESFTGIAGPPPIVIRNGIARQHPSQRPPLAKPSSPKELRICMLAHFDEQKRHEDVIRAAARVNHHLPTAKFFLFGSTFGEESSVRYRRSLRVLVKELGLDGVVIMRTTQQAGLELRRATVSLMPSVDESSSNAILESMACGTPVIAADSGGNKEMIESGLDGLLVQPHSPDALAKAILEVTQNSDLASRLAKGGHQRLERDYDISRCARQYEQFYRKCLDNTERQTRQKR